MAKIRKAEERGRVDFGWLQGFHTFSFGEYHDPEWMGYRSLRVINTDLVAPRGGFPTHPHRDMEIVTYMLSGAIEHQDSMGNGSTIRAGEVQRMTAGTGVTHSEFNPSDTEEARLLQIWLFPREKGLSPTYEQIRLRDDELKNRLCVIASPDGREGSVIIQQDASIYAAKLEAGTSVRFAVPAGHGVWVQVVEGRIQAGSTPLGPGDGAAFEEESALELIAESDAHLLVFDLA